MVVGICPGVFTILPFPNGATVVGIWPGVFMILPLPNGCMSGGHSSRRVRNRTVPERGNSRRHLPWLVDDGAVPKRLNESLRVCECGRQKHSYNREKQSVHNFPRPVASKPTLTECPGLSRSWSVEKRKQKPYFCCIRSPRNPLNEACRRRPSWVTARYSTSTRSCGFTQVAFGFFTAFERGDVRTTMGSSRSRNARPVSPVNPVPALPA